MTTIRRTIPSCTLKVSDTKKLKRGHFRRLLTRLGQDYLDRAEDIVGSVRGYIPMVGYVTIMLSEHPWLKTVMLGLMGLMVMIQRE